MIINKEEVDTLICALDDIRNMWGFRPEEEEIYNKLVEEGDKNE